MLQDLKKNQAQFVKWNEVEKTLVSLSLLSPFPIQTNPRIRLVDVIIHSYYRHTNVINEPFSNKQIPFHITIV